MEKAMIEKAQQLSLEISGLLTLMKHDSNCDALAIVKEKLSELTSMVEGDAKATAPVVAESHEETEQPAPVEVEMPATVDTSTINIEPTPAEMPAREEDHSESPTRDLRRAVTLNDRYLFCRELFDMDNSKLNSALETLGNFKSFEQARDYAITTLGLNTENPATEYFLNFISRNYK